MFSIQIHYGNDILRYDSDVQNYNEWQSSAHLVVKIRSGMLLKKDFMKNEKL